MLAGSFAGAVVAELALGTAIAFASGADSALLWVALERAGRAGEYTRWEGRLQAAAQTAESLSAVCGGYLYAVAPAPVALLAPAPVGVARARGRPPHTRGTADERRGRRWPPTSPVQRLLGLARLVLYRHARLRTTIGLSVALGLSSFVLVWLIQPYMEGRGVPTVWFGPIWAAANLWVAGAALASHAGAKWGIAVDPLAAAPVRRGRCPARPLR